MGQGQGQGQGGGRGDGAASRWVLEDDVDPDTLKQFQQLELRDRRRWTVADRDKNLQLTEEEFKAFLHPEHYSHMYSVNRDETMADLDTVSGDCWCIPLFKTAIIITVIK